MIWPAGTLVLSAAVSFAADLMFGDPAWLPHPVVIMGKCIIAAEKWLRAHFPATPEGELRAGAVLAGFLPVMTFLITVGALRLISALHPGAAFFLNAFWGWQAIAVRDLAKESTNVYRKLTAGTLQEARQAVSRIVGRDTERLTAEGVTKAAVETVAESFSDGVAAPLMYLIIGGAPLALTYKSINTMDSMIGYKNSRYLYFGRGAAKLDDIANYVPSRMAAMMLIAAAFMCGRGGEAFRIWRRDRRRHASPNSGQTEAAMAGALGIQLAGPAWYFGEYYDKPTIGDALRPAVPEDIMRANRLLYQGSFLCFLKM
ncbi:MAG: adenosylcobinamide-phosphate synthase CbiB [Lachnospiraceae bacterium]|nr:adenosylcobinamide-phosphate synthase CbiB [Lachnospiraceae bacterium]